MHFVVVWSGGHQLALDLPRARVIQRAIQRAMPGMEARIEEAETYSSAAVGAPPPARERRGEGRAERASRPRRRRAA